MRTPGGKRLSWDEVSEWHGQIYNRILATKRNEIELFVVRWMDLESVLQSEVSQKEKNKYPTLTHIYGI